MMPESIFGLPLVDEGPYDFPRLPILYRASYEGRYTRIGSVPCIVVTPKSQLKLLQVEKLCQIVSESESLPVLVHAQGATAYQRKAMTEHGIAWISTPNTFSIPFLAVSCNERELRDRTAKTLTANAQKVAVGAIGGALMGMTTTQIADLLGVSLSSASNYFLELEAVCNGIVGSRGRTRFLQMPVGMTKESLFDTLRPYMSSPVQKRMYVKAIDRDLVSFEALPISGMSALSLRTNLADDPWRTRALFRGNVQDRFPFLEVVGEHDQPDVLVELWRYEPWIENNTVDEISLLLDLEEYDGMGDERLDEAVELLRRDALL